MESREQNSAGKILIIDPDPEICSIYENIFTRQGYEIKSARDSGQVGQMAEGKWQPDVIILEWLLPDVPESEGAAHVLKYFWESPTSAVSVIIHSSYVGLPGYDLSIRDMENKFGKKVYRSISKSDRQDLIIAVDELFKFRTEDKKKVSKILVVDDEEDITETLDVYLSKEGFEVICAVDGQDALEKYHEHMPDLIISDYKMPNMDGLELLTRIRSFDPKIPFFMLTSYDLALHSLRLKATDFIQKPADYEYVTFSVQRALNARKSQEELETYKKDSSEFYAIRQFLYSLIPEMENPLVEISNTVEKLKEHPELEKYSGDIKILELSNEKLFNLTTRLFHYSSLDKKNLVLQEQNFAEILSTAVMEMQTQIKQFRKEDISLIFESSSDEEACFIFDKERITFVVSELITNAVRWTKSGQIHIRYEVFEDLIETTVQDYGEGIETEIKDFLFLPGNTLNYMQDNTIVENPFRYGQFGIGLGLPTVKKIVEFHDGKIWFSSSPGQGTSFHFTISRNLKTY